jgi:hypothetical protein
MSRQQDEIERLKRLRERQLADRDPRARDRAVSAKVRARRQTKKLTLKNVVADFTAKWTWMVAGGLVGAVLAIVVNVAFKAAWAEYVGYGLVLFGIVMGRLFGAIRDWGDEDWDKRY